MCPTCYTNHSVAIAPFVNDFSRWVIYRDNYIEVLIIVKNQKIISSSKRLTKIEKNHIKKHIIWELKANIHSTQDEELGK